MSIELIPSDRHSTIGYCTFLGGNLVYWKSKSKMFFTRYNVRVDYCIMTIHHVSQHASFMYEMTFEISLPRNMFWDNQAATQITFNADFRRDVNMSMLLPFVRDKI